MTTLTKNEPRKPQPQTPQQTETFFTPPTNIREVKDAYILEVEMPGVSKQGLDVTVEGNDLIILGRRSDPPLEGMPVIRESRPIAYRRVFELDPSIDTGKMMARIDQGILTLTMPKAEQVKPRKIEVTD
jgi:HSP20 family protein